MNNNTISIKDRSKQFASIAIKAYTELNKRHYNDAGRVLAKQFLRSATSIAANLAESEFAQSKADFLSKNYIALKEAAETRMWIELMIESEIAPKYKFSLMLEEINIIIRILISITKKLKK